MKTWPCEHIIKPLGMDLGWRRVSNYCHIVERPTIFCDICGAKRPDGSVVNVYFCEKGHAHKGQGCTDEPKKLWEKMMAVVTPAEGNMYIMDKDRIFMPLAETTKDEFERVVDEISGYSSGGPQYSSMIDVDKLKERIREM